MRVLYTLMVILYVKILSSTVAPERVPSPEKQLQSVSDLLIITGLGNLRRSGVPDQVIENYLREKCERNGGPYAYDAAKKIPRQISGLGISLAIHLTVLQAELSLLQRDARLANPDTLFNNYCGEISLVEEQLNNFEDSTKPCLDPEDREEMEIVHNMMSTFLEFFCNHRREFIATVVLSIGFLLLKEPRSRRLYPPTYNLLISAFRTTGGLECWVSKYKAMLNCFVQSPSSHIPWSRSLSQRDRYTVECVEMKNLESCILKVYEECDDLTPAKLVRSLIDHSTEAAPCKNLINPQILPLTGHQEVGNAKNDIPDVPDSQVPTL